jgi:Leucine-rich repeat (LRR) protein
MHRAAMEDVDVEPVHKKQKIDVELLDVDATQQQVKTIEEYFTKHFPEQIPTLQTLNASSNYITKFSLLSSSQSKLFDGTYLTRLLVNANNLAEMPPVSAFPNCIELCLNNNKIPELTSELRALTKLERLDLRFNRIEVLQHIDHLTNLKQ